FSEPDGIAAGTAADVRDRGRRRRQIPLEERLRADEFQRAQATREPVALESPSIERGDFLGVARAVAHSVIIDDSASMTGRRSGAQTRRTLRSRASGYGKIPSSRYVAATFLSALRNAAVRRSPARVIFQSS